MNSPYQLVPEVEVEGANLITRNGTGRRRTKM